VKRSTQQPTQTSRLVSCLGLLWNYIFPTVSLIALWTTMNPLFVLIIPIYLFVALPILDYVIGERDVCTLKHSPENGTFFLNLLYLQIPLHFFLLGFTLFIVANAGLPLWSELILVMSVGFNNGLAIILGHELGHKADKKPRTAAKIALACDCFGHFLIEHTRGHHVYVATPEDCASARLGESIYTFVLREIPGEIIGGLGKEAERLRSKGEPVFSISNEVLQSYALSAVIAVFLMSLFGLLILPWILLHHLSSAYMMALVNYIEHYGILREKKYNGKYVSVTAKHSWDSNYRLSNLLLQNAQRHSDHHQSPMKPYQDLDRNAVAPRLPLGYPAMMLLASVPVLWFKVMNPKVIEWAGGDLNKAHIHEPCRKRLEALYLKT